MPSEILVPEQVSLTNGGFTHADSLAGINKDKALELLLQRSDWVPEEKTLYLDIEARGIYHEFPGEKKTGCFLYSNVLDHWSTDSQGFKSLCLDVNFSEIPSNYFTAIIRIGKFSKKNMAIVSSLAKQGVTKIWLVGTNAEGIKGLSKKVIRELSFLEEIHCEAGCGARLLGYQVVKVASEIDVQKWHELPLLKHPMGNIPSYSGLFSAEKLDVGSELLIRNLPNLKEKSLLDIGCGGGALTFAAYKLGAKVVHATDCSITAIEALKSWSANISEITCEVDYIASHQKELYDVILSNPPYHKGMEVRYSIGKEWLSQIVNCLKPQGEAWLVVNSFLDYASFGKPFFTTIELVEKEAGYSVFKMVK